MRLSCDICVLGGGPAGSVLASRLAQFGHSVCLLERSAFPRPSLGESLNPGVLPLLELVQGRELVETAGFCPVREVRVAWNGPSMKRNEGGKGGLLVDRGRFDELLLENARSFGVKVLQPATASSLAKTPKGWQVEANLGRSHLEVETAFLANATGRATTLERRRRAAGARTTATYAYWSGTGLPKEPRIEAGLDGWFWGVPLPDGTYNTLLFTDPEWHKADTGEPLRARFLRAISDSSLFDRRSPSTQCGPVRVTDASAYIDEESVDGASIKVGDAAVALDPLSSSGVQKAIQTSLIGAVVVNTLLRKPALAEAAFRFYRNFLSETSERHALWAAAHYRSAARPSTATFWSRRAVSKAQADPELWAPPPRAGRGAVTLCRRLEFVEVPCIEGEFIAVKQAIRHPSLSEPVAFLGGREIAPLLRGVPASASASDLSRLWSGSVGPAKAAAAVAWLLDRGILVEAAGATRAYS